MLETVEDVIEALGGPAEMARRLKTSPSNISHMKKKGSIPSTWYWSVTNELWEINKEAHPKIFRMRGT